uniref:Uncharacterized protein n=1 Tax=Anguilla anguilla TaxID=7936 RepID=A0A0E9Q848_ANGAN
MPQCFQFEPPRVLVSFMIAVWYAVTLFWLRAT